jgi:hypothetical protein
VTAVRLTILLAALGSAASSAAEAATKTYLVAIGNNEAPAAADQPRDEAPA